MQISSAIFLSYLTPLILAQQFPSAEEVLSDSDPKTANFEMVGDSKFFTKCLQPNTVALTFDDGPSEDNTGALLDILKSEGVKATFFVVGSMLEDAQAAALTKRAALEGHTIGSHSYSHTSFQTLSLQQVRDEMTRTSNLIQQLTGQRGLYFRPPYGEITPASAKLINEMGYTLVHWNFDSLDWRSKSADVDVQVVQRYAKSGNTYNMLFHDIHPTSVAAQTRVIRHLKSLNFKFVSMEECLGSSVTTSTATSKTTKSSSRTSSTLTSTIAQSSSSTSTSTKPSTSTSPSSLTSTSTTNPSKTSTASYSSTITPNSTTTTSSYSSKKTPCTSTQVPVDLYGNDVVRSFQASFLITFVLCLFAANFQ